MWELDYKESWAPKNWCFWTVVLEKTLESPLDCKEIKPVYPKGNQPWIFTGRAEAEAPIIRPPDAKCWLIRKDMDAGRVWGQAGNDKEWDWMATSIQATWVWANSRILKDREACPWWGKLQPMGSPRVGHDWVTEEWWHPELKFRGYCEHILRMEIARYGKWCQEKMQIINSGIWPLYRWWWGTRIQSSGTAVYTATTLTTASQRTLWIVSSESRLHKLDECKPRISFSISSCSWLRPSLE